MKRYLHNKSHYRLVATRMGQLTPVSAFEVIPGDTVQIQNMAMIRVSPLVTPVMHPVTVHFINYFVPNRILDPSDGSFKFEDFITGGEDGQYTTPPPEATGVTVAKGSVIERFGIPPGTRTYNTFVPKAYAAIWNNDFRDQQLQTEINIDTYDGSGDPLKVSWEKDRFTMARPEPQLGDDTILPLGTRANIHVDDASGTDLTIFNDANSERRKIGTPDTFADISATAGSGGILYADLSSATGASVNDVRRAFAIQRYKEARNLYGARFTEYLRYLGIRSSDARLQRPELISRGKATINFSEVLQTSDTTQNVLGTLGGHGIAGARSRRARYFCEEPGHVISLMYARPKAMYLTAQHAMWNRKTKEDYWQKELQHIGQEPIDIKELYADGVATDPLGWAPRYSSFNDVPSLVSGDFRDTLDSWHLARDFASEPALNPSLIECDPSDRIYADTSPDTDKLWCTIRNRVAVRSLLRKGISSRII